jgi:hypothetical protein
MLLPFLGSWGKLSCGAPVWFLLIVATGDG